MQKILNENTTPEFIGQIVDIIEDKLTELKVELPTDEKEQALEDGENPEEIAILYGRDYDIIGDEVRYVLEGGIANLPTAIADAVIEAFKNNFEDTGRMTPLSDADRKAIHDKITETCMNWGLS